MADPLTLTAVSAVALTEGIKFLYAQAGEVLKAWREARKSNEASAEVEFDAPDAAFDRAPQRAEIDFAVVGRLEQDLRDLRASLGDHATGVDEIDRDDHATLERIDAMRRVLETIYGDQFVFRGEPARPSDTPLARGEAAVDEVHGYVAGLRARRLVGGSVIGRVQAGRVESGGQAVGVEIDTIG